MTMNENELESLASQIAAKVDERARVLAAVGDFMAAKKGTKKGGKIGKMAGFSQRRSGVPITSAVSALKPHKPTSNPLTPYQEAAR